jgi:geranylgeranyl reductase
VNHGEPARSRPPLGWLGVIRIGLIQASLGAVVVIATSTLNRVMIVELALPAIIPGALVALHYALQVMRPRWGYGSDRGGRRTPWIIGGMAALCAGGALAAAGVALMADDVAFGLAVAVLGFAMVGTGAGCAGTTLLVLLSKRVAQERRPAAATIVWIMMIMGFAVTAGVAGRYLDPFSGARLVAVSACISAIAIAITLLAIRGIENGDASASEAEPGAPRAGFCAALADAWREPQTRLFTILIFVSMLAYSAQDLILEPFAAILYDMTPGQTTSLSGLQHAGILVGMIALAIAGTILGSRGKADLLRLTALGCALSGIALLLLVAAGFGAALLSIEALVFILGAANGLFAAAAIAAMMTQVGSGRAGREGTRMGMWGASQAIAFGVGGLTGAGAADIARWILDDAIAAFSIVFAGEALLFVLSALLAYRIANVPQRNPEAREILDAEISDADIETYDVAIVGGGPAGATAAEDLARAGAKVLLLDRAGRIKPCGGAIPPRLIADFAIPDSLLVARIGAARMIAPSGKHVDIPIEGGFVGMVDRDVFDEFLRDRAQRAGATRRTGAFDRLLRDAAGGTVLRWHAKSSDGRGAAHHARVKLVIGADGANSAVARQEIGDADRTNLVFAYHEIVESPVAGAADFDPARCDVIYRGSTSPDFYAWIFPHGATASIGTGSALKGFSLRDAVAQTREIAGLAGCKTLRREGAPIPLKPLPRWDNGRDVLLAGDAAGVVAPASGEGIYYAMYGGRVAAEAGMAFLASGDASTLAAARKRFLGKHGIVFLVLGIMQRFWYASEKRRESFVDICRDRDVQKLTFDAYMNKELVRAKPGAHMRIFFKDLGHLLGVLRP